MKARLTLIKRCFFAAGSMIITTDSLAARVLPTAAETCE